MRYYSNNMTHRNTINKRKAISVAYFLMISMPLYAESETYFEVKPDQCISLHQGQVCYQKLTFKWQVAGRGQYCLYQLGALKPLQCWKTSEQQAFTYEFAAANSQTFQLRSSPPLVGQDNLLVETRVKVSSVYKKGRKSANVWRLF